MKLVAENSARDLAKRRAENELRVALRGLAANVLRIIRGAGKPTEVAPQCQRVVNASQNFRDAVGVWPDCEVAIALDAEPDRDLLKKLPNEEIRILLSKQAIYRGAMQVIASRMVNQRTHETAGEREVSDGIFSLEDAYSAWRQRGAVTHIPDGRGKPKKPRGDT